MIVPEVRRYLSIADRLLPGRITGFYVVGSTALGAFRRGRSDIDFVAVTEGTIGLPRLRALQWTANTPGGLRQLARGNWAIPGTVNGVFVPREELTRPVTQIRPVASHSGSDFSAGAAFDVNPVTWKVLREHGIAVRGAEPAELGLDPEPARLMEWNLANLRGYWKGLAERTARRAKPSLVGRKTGMAWTALGPPRLHHTIVTGGVISKEAAGEYALDVFDARWHPFLRGALAYWRGGPPAEVRPGEAAEFVLDVIADAERLSGGGSGLG
ncbi:nucleotidyltransferase domain-containing protein [Nonomuraea sp. NPDC050394]|uniref:nucleotidyltransferase domain-containing protein n=1 Tax=Nonomuraea sp. NPDC050394 TaxID=3364363 RepID=UPI0037AD0DD2